MLVIEGAILLLPPPFHQAKKARPTLLIWKHGTLHQKRQFKVKSNVRLEVRLSVMAYILSQRSVDYNLIPESSQTKQK